MENLTSHSLEHCKEKAKQIVCELIDKYSEHPYMFQKTYNAICFQLPCMLENMKKNYEQNQLRIKEMECEQEQFIQSFLNNNQYFYVQTTEKYFYYDGVNYQVYNEDDILYHVLSSISKERQLMSWKKSTKVYVMKRIKENNLLKSVPESDTIQVVLDAIFPILFHSRDEAKYFLTILGDAILKKNNDIVYFLTPKSKPFLRELSNLCQLLLGVNCSHSIKHKYYEHEYSNCRILQINDTIQNETIWSNILTNHALNILCVACHYSIRYENGDNYIQTRCNNMELITRALYLKNTSKSELVKQFVGEYIQNCELFQSPNAIISWKNMQYLWKHFLDTKQMPTIMFQQSLKTLLVQHFNEEYDKEEDVFYGLTSKYLPAIQKFMCFWEENITVDNDMKYMDYEIEELCFLFKKWMEQSGQCDKSNPSIFINDIQMLELIQYYYPEVEIEENKYIYNIRCVLWDKQQDIEHALEQLKETVLSKYRHSSEENNQKTIQIISSYGSFEPLQHNYATTSHQHNNTSGYSNISIYDAYVWYCKYYSEQKHNNMLVSKSYFERYIIEYIGRYVIDNKFISMEWVYS